MSTPEHTHPKVAVALRYDSASGSAPRVTAKGRGEIAEEILRTARAHGVPVREDGDLVQLLSACELLDEIPVELYAAVAHVLAYLHALNQERAGGEMASGT
jgi:flagellar biosynthesis protein